MAETFHRRGNHVQKAHGRRTALAAQDSHLSGGMIALMPTAQDARRLALPGGEAPEELHCTLLYLGDDGSVFTPADRDEMEAAVQAYTQGLGPVQSKIFGVAHWNGDGEKPSWVWSVGDGPDAEGPGLAKVRAMVYAAAEDVAGELLPEQHSPWVAHICAAYTDDLTLVRRLEKGLGPVTFDRIRLSFGDDDRDIPLKGEALTASALRRDILPHEDGTDFAEHNAQWENAVALADGRLIQVFSVWRAEISDQIKAGIDTPDELTGLTADPDAAAEILSEAMLGLAHRAGQSLARQAEKQGVTVPDWSLPDDTVTAAVGGRKLLRSVAQMTADLLSSSVVQTAKRTVTGLFARDASPETIATEVDRALADAQDGLLKGPVGTAMSTAQTAGREAVLRAAPPGAYYASEMLDRNTCGPCRAVDGEQFGDLERAIKAYPVMGYKDCVGPRYGHSCRGLIVARWAPEETEPVTAAGDEVPFHGSIGNPGYPLLHPGVGKKRTGRTKHSNGGLLGSSRFSEEAHSEGLRKYLLDSQDVNEWLRHRQTPGGGNPDEVKHRIAVLNDLVAVQEPSAKEETYWRGTKAALPPMQIGDEFHDKGFTSVSSSKWVAESVFSDRGGGIVSIRAPKGTQGLRVASVGKSDMEEETILAPGTKYRVVGIIRAEPPRPTGYELEIVHG